MRHSHLVLTILLVEGSRGMSQELPNPWALVDTELVLTHPAAEYFPYSFEVKTPLGELSVRAHNDRKWFTLFGTYNYRRPFRVASDKKLGGCVALAQPETLEHVPIFPFRVSSGEPPTLEPLGEEHIDEICSHFRWMPFKPTSESDKSNIAFYLGAKEGFVEMELHVNGEDVSLTFDPAFTDWQDQFTVFYLREEILQSHEGDVIVCAFKSDPEGAQTHQPVFTQIEWSGENNEPYKTQADKGEECAAKFASIRASD